jgi:hypothetical protein
MRILNKLSLQAFGVIADDGIHAVTSTSALACNALLHLSGTQRASHSGTQRGLQHGQHHNNPTDPGSWPATRPVQRHINPAKSLPNASRHQWAALHSLVATVTWHHATMQHTASMASWTTRPGSHQHHRYTDDYDKHHRLNTDIYSNHLRVIHPDGHIEVGSSTYCV